MNILEPLPLGSNEVSEKLTSTQSALKSEVKPENKIESEFSNSDVDVKKSNESSLDVVNVSKDDFFAEIRENLKKINEFIPVQSTSLIFEFDELGDPPIVKVLDKNSNEVIREIPPKEFREMAQALEKVADTLSASKGVLFNDLV